MNKQRSPPLFVTTATTELRHSGRLALSNKPLPLEHRYLEEDGRWFAQKKYTVSTQMTEELELGNFPLDVQPLSLVSNFAESEEPWVLVGDESNERGVIVYSNYINLAGTVIQISS